MSCRVLVGFITVNILVTLAVVAIFVSLYQNYWRPEEPGEGPTQIVFLTATPLPGRSSSLKNTSKLSMPNN